MSQKVVYYYSISIRDSLTNVEVDNIKKVFDVIFKENCVNNNEIRTLSLGNGEVTLDILLEDENYLFGRVGKETEFYNILKRNKETLKYEYVLNGDDVNNSSLEICTYFLLDYTTGIVGFIFGKTAPNVNSLVNIVSEHSEKYTMNIIRIASEESVRALLRPGSYLSKISYAFRVPNVEILEKVGLTRTQLASLANAEIFEAELIIKNRRRKPITDDQAVLENIVNTFSKLPDQIKNSLRFSGKTPNSLSKDYKFEEQDISFHIDIDEYKIENGNKIKLEADEVAAKVLHKLRGLYTEHRTDIMRYAGLDY
ncbi:hypothetical protein SAMN05428976_11358 [Clostridium sp. USBA 49]|uniref:hypothetical protein n=1 Tax=Clostridium sp. USBA 49 TaxID=1881060 RepID=UPI00099AC216|nr:hypothetical protein [Clostridium sp. USBA 49]SKA89783.1 hypothetical protein SAMN05428976_11358 [Clostridium sp. USBA 49]